MPDNNKFERCRHAVKDELEDSYCACDVSLFDSEINLLLSLEKEKIEEIETSKSLIVKNQNNLPVLEQELVEIKNRIKK